MYCGSRFNPGYMLRGNAPACPLCGETQDIKELGQENTDVFGYEAEDDDET